MDKLDLMLGKPLIISGMTIRHPKISDVCEYGEELYSQTIGVFVNKPSDLMVKLDDIGIDYSSISNYQLFVMMCEGLNKSYGDRYDKDLSNMLLWLTGVIDFRLIDKGDESFLFSESTEAKIDMGVYVQIRKFLMDMNYRSEKERYNPANDVTRKALIKEERRKQERQSRRARVSVLASQVSSLIWGGAKTQEDVLSMYVYQMYDGLDRICRIKSYDQIMASYYSGNITSEKMDSIKEEIDWMS